MKRRLLYDEIDWISAHRAVFLMQQEIAVAYNLNDKKLVHKLQERLVRSFASNLKLLHKACHKQVTYSKSIKLRAAWLRDGIISC